MQPGRKGADEGYVQITSYLGGCLEGTGGGGADAVTDEDVGRVEVVDVKTSGGLAA